MHKQTEPSPTSLSADGVLAKYVHLVWDEARALLAPALDGSLGRYDSGSVFEELAAGRMQLWCVWEGGMIAAIVTQINIWPTGMKTVRLVAAGGVAMEKWIHMMDIIEAWARHHDCRLLEVGGRAGWRKVLGWEQTAVELVKDLSDE